jgi:hypothetical protein
VGQYLDKCTIAIHLLGRHYGVTPEDSSESVPALQVRLTAEWAERNALQHLVWLPGTGIADDARQRLFIGRVQEDPKLHYRAEFIEANLNLLKQDLIRRLDRPRVLAANVFEFESGASTESPPGCVGRRRLSSARR